MMDLHIIWFRDDLRIHDNAALNAAVSSGGHVLPLFIFDPSDWAQTERTGRQFDMLTEAVADLRTSLQARGADLCIRTGSPARILADIHREHGIRALHFHHETSGDFALLRDRRIAQWCRQAGISLRAQDQHGIAMKDHPHLAELAADHLSAACKIAPDTITMAPIASEGLPSARDLSIAEDDCPARTDGRRASGIALLKAFLSGRARDYDGQPQAPEGVAISSRLSAHLALGTLSSREVWQYASRARFALNEDGDSTFVNALDRFLERLQSRRRLLQAVEDSTTLSGRAFTPATGPSDNENLLMEALMRGRTGFPIIDAAIRCAHHTGWLPYRMRALLMGFATRLLWLDPNNVAQGLAGLMTDYSPALHYMNVQRMMTGQPSGQHIVHTSRRLSEHGDFLRAWLPELAALNDAEIHAPWDAPKANLKRANVILGQTYPMPVVDHVATASSSTSAPAAKAFAQPHLPMSAVNRRAPSQAPRRTKKVTSPEQLSFDLGPAVAA